VRSLLEEQHPDLADLELREVAGGWDNKMWRLGHELAVRMPRTARAPFLLRGEQRWLPFVAPALPLPVPVPVRIGEPSPRFSSTWTITRWVEGEPADSAPITDREAAGILAGFLTALHREAPAGAPANPARGGPLRRESFDQWLPASASGSVAASARRVWEDAVAAPPWPGPPVWLHGDLHPANVVVSGGTLAGVLDFGELCAGDPATDLAAAWVLLPAGTASRFFDAYATADDATIRRARGWAVVRAFVLIAIGMNGERGLPGGKPTWLPAGRAALERVLADAPLASERVVHLQASGRAVDRDGHAVSGQQSVVINDRGARRGEADPVTE
jgi:aminoglycoside phosphotransferase (APT) family kinase protein